MNKRQKKKIIWLPGGKNGTCKRAKYIWLKERKKFQKFIIKMIYKAKGYKTTRGITLGKWLYKK